MRDEHPLLCSSLLLLVSVLIGILVHLTIEKPILRRLKSRKQSLVAIGVAS